MRKFIMVLLFLALGMLLPGLALADSTGTVPPTGGLLWGWLDPVIAWVLTLILGLGGVAGLLAKYLPLVRRWSSTLAKLLGLLEDVLRAVEDGKVTSDEVSDIRAKVSGLLKDLGTGTVPAQALHSEVEKRLGLG